jgi:hypothetical protein
VSESRAPEASRGLVLLTREECGLCETMQLELAELAHSLPLPPLVLLDVDSSPDLQRRHGLKVPVLLWDGQVIATTRLDPAEIRRLFRPR